MDKKNMENNIGNSAETPENKTDAAAQENDSKSVPPNNADNNQAEDFTADTKAEIPAGKALISKIKEKLIAIGYENTIGRLLTAWIIISGYEIISSKPLFTSFDFFNGINMFFYLLFIAIVFSVLTVINKPWLDKILLFFSTLIYGSYAVINDNRLYFTIGVCIFMGAVAVYCVGDWVKLKLKKLPTIIIIAVLGVAFTLFVGLLTSFLYLRYLSPCFDFGIFSQMFNYMKETFQPLTTCERDRLLSHFAVHFSPIYYLLLPFFYIFPSPITLLIGQAAVIASGLIPLYLICKKYKFPNTAIILFSLCYVLMPSMANGCFYFIHENKFLTALILWLVYALEKNKWIPTIIFTFLLLLVKEDAPVYAAVLGLYFVMSRRRISKGAVVFGISVIYFIVVSALMAKYGLGTMSYRYDNFIYDGSGNLTTVIKAVILNPIFAVYESFDEEKITFILQMLVPLAFMPLMSKKPSRIIMFIPFILLNLMSDYVYQHDINFQYTYGSAAFLIYLMILNYNDMKPKFRSRALAVAACSSILMFMCNTYHRSDGFKNYMEDVKNGSIKEINEVLELVPKDASVTASTFFVPNLYKCRELYEFESTEHKDAVEYTVIDMRFDSESANEYSSNPIYETIAYVPGKIAIFRNTTING